MVLADTNVIIDLWHNASEEDIKLFYEDDIVTCGVVKSELMHGAYSKKNLNQIEQELQLLREYNIQDDQWEEFGRFLYNLRISGLSLPYPDALIAFIAIKNNLKLKTKDKHFKLIHVVMPELQLI